MKDFTRILLFSICCLISTSSSAQESFFVVIEDGKLHCQKIGEGKPILILNGGPGMNSNGFLKLGERLAGFGYQVILFDQRGTGKSDLVSTDSTTITMELMAEDIEAIRKHMNIDNWIVLGHSFGGILANYYATKYPESITGMIHSSSGGIDLSILGTAGERIDQLLTGEEQDSLRYWRQQRSLDDSPENGLEYARALAKAYVFFPENEAAVSERLTQINLPINNLVWQDLRRINYDCKESLADFSQPVLIIQGKQDIVTTEMAMLTNRVFSNAKLVLLDSCGHYGWLDQEEKYFDEIKKYLYAFEKEEIERVIGNYVKSIYNQDTSLIQGYTDELLQKSGYFFSRKDKVWSYHFMSLEELKNTALSYNSRDWIPSWAPIDIDIFEIKEKVASTKVKAIWGFDYILLSKSQRGNWKIDKILWQSYSEIEAKEYLGKLNQQYTNG